ncbi:uncharacterized protein LOC130995486 [Salvia miltiorrhiza]|uniref:uncharacterized protein LOC130995486 n=1 Tax=Salvia miltiorrhiza TaxID=226208 RepID=UPI0025AD8062|nr:uncharacterized protein LOC130995486 [Salvia miltiorrhiza]
MNMCAKASFFVLFLCFFMHAYTTTPSSALHNKFLPQKIEEKLEFNKFGPNGRVTLTHDHNLRSKSSRHDLCKINKGGRSRADCKSSLHKALLQLSEDSRWRHLNVREVDLQNSSILSEEDLSESDYEPPHRKSPIHNK